ncbi:glycoside hydrolase domain-containing protein [Nocardioides sp. W7]|uniref:glycoside hydrolase domain-containing protein n=1 Tax=Nocardioides sp. W7 TaxID=2931390 RepID=UPI001FD3291E|nr:glycoside hydrolase domain-containing protein [Nocardioides sp. W7]
MRRPARLPVRAALAATLTGLLVATTGVVLAVGGSSTLAAEDATASYPVSSAVAAKRSTNPVTPGDFTGYGFDQCLTPDQAKMNRWLARSPFLAVGIYISGKSRACRSQPNLTPTWVATQLRKGWRLLPITLGPQASCQPRFPRYSDDVRIDPRPGTGTYGRAYRMGVAEAETTVVDAQALGIVAGSTLWYDLEGYDSKNTHCRESALRFLSGWTVRIRELGYVSGVYSSAGSGIRDLDNARVDRPGMYVMPDRIWVARWDGKANTSTSYLRPDGWLPGGRVKQYQGGHDETWGGVRINIDRNFLDVGHGSIAAAELRCGGVRLDLRAFRAIRRAAAPTAGSRLQVKALQCLLKEKGLYQGSVTGRYNKRTVRAARTWQATHSLRVSDNWSRPSWMSLLGDGSRTLLKYGSAGEGVRRLQRALNAAVPTAKLTVSGVFGATTDRALKTYQSRVGHAASGVATAATWRAFSVGKRRR